jgi:sugar lactone lactonase YvrE
VSSVPAPDRTATCVLPARAQLGECPTWSVAEARLYWIDIDGRAVHRFDPATGHDEARSAPGRPGSLALTATPGRVLVAVEDRLAFLDWDSSAWTDWFALEPADNGNRMNDGRADPAGRFWVGSMSDRANDGVFSGMLHRIEPDGTAAVTRTGIGISNSVAFSPDARTMYFGDTTRDLVWAFDYNVSSGEATNERLFLDFATLPGRPDGAAMDEDGCYWIAAVYASAVLRVTPDGRVDRTIALAAPKPTMIAFGGPDRSTLFITTIGGGGSHEVDPAYPDAGGLFAVEAGVRGLAEPVFAGGPPTATT